MSEFKLIQGGVSCDDRGSVRFVNDFDPMTLGVRRFYQVQNYKAGYIRAFHGHLKEGKYVYVSRGAALVVATEMVKNDFDNWELNANIQRVVLNAETPKIWYIPPGYANGFKTLTDDATLIFYSTSTLEESKGDDIRFDWDYLNDKYTYTGQRIKVWEEDYR